MFRIEIELAVEPVLAAGADARTILFYGMASLFCASGHGGRESDASVRSVAFFFEEVPEQTATTTAPAEPRALQALALRPENMRLVEALNRIPAQQQKAIRRLIKALAEVESVDEAD